MDTKQIFETLWAHSEGDYVFLPYMQNGVWREEAAVSKDSVPLYGPNLLAVRDQYFTPLTYVGNVRRKGMLGRPGVIFADLDGNHTAEPRLKPSLVITTSPGHSHAYWLLNEPADAVEWEGHAKGWSQEIGADPGGWDATQVLRYPGGMNHKYDPPVPVTAILWRPDRVYDLSQFPKVGVNIGSVGQAEPVPSEAERKYLIKAGIEDDRLPLSARYWLTATEAQIAALGKIDRSKIMWQIEITLVSAGYTPYEVFHLMYFSGINKFRGRPDRLWYEVNKAAGLH